MTVNTYDGLMIFSNSLTDEAVQKSMERVQGEITRLGGAVKGSRLMGKHMFARTMKKQESGTYASMTFDLPPSQIAALQARLKLNEEVFRVQITRAEKIPVEFQAAPAPVADGEKRDGQPQ